MELGVHSLQGSLFPGSSHGSATGFRNGAEPRRNAYAHTVSTLVDGWLERVAPCPWGATAGLRSSATQDGGRGRAEVHDQRRLTPAPKARPAPLYTSAERARRDASPWTVVQAVLAPIQFAICAASLILIARYLATGHGYALATGSILLKTAALYAIMITGSIWEKEVFGRWLFAPSFFWEDVVSMVVLALQTTYVACLVMGWGSPGEQMTVAVAAYAAYAVNASQFLMKLRAARLAGAPRHAVAA